MSIFRPNRRHDRCSLEPHGESKFDPASHLCQKPHGPECDSGIFARKSGQTKIRSRFRRIALSYILARSSTFPCEFGFIPSTLGDDGDPLDIVIMMDAATCAGCVVSARALGVVEAEQTQDGSTFQNDRIIAIAVAEHERAQLRSLDEIAPALLDEIDIFLLPTIRCAGVSSSPFIAQAQKQYRNYWSGASRALASGKTRTGTEIIGASDFSGSPANVPSPVSLPKKFSPRAS